MSYILDALKRAERDRRLAPVPTLATVHSSAHRTRPRWLWVGGGVLLVNAIVETIPDVSQFWKYDPKDYLKMPLYDRNVPPCRYC